MLKKLLSNTLIYALGPQVPKFVTFFIYPIITKHLNSTDYGIYGLIIAYTSLLGVIKDLGLRTVLITTFYKHRFRYKFLWKQIHGILIYWIIIYAALLAILIYFTIPSEANANLFLIIVLNCIPILLFENTITLGDNYFRVKEKPVSVVTIAVIAGIITIILNLITIVYLKMGYMGWFVSTFISSFVTFLYYGYFMYLRENFLPIFNATKSQIKEYFNASLPIIPHQLAGYILNTSDRLIMTYLNVPIKDIGLYNIAYIFGNYFAFFANAMGAAAGPMFMRYYSEGEREKGRTLTYLMQVFFLAISFCFCLWLKEIFYLLIKNDELQSAYPLGILIIMGYNFKPMLMAATNILYIESKTVQLLKISFAAAIINIILNIILIPFWGIKAAAITTLLCLLYMGFSGFFLKNFKKNVELPYYPMLWLLLIIFLTFIVYFIKDINFWIKAFITVIVSLFIIGGYKKYRSIIIS